MAEFVVKYRAIVYRPFKDETVDGIVSIVNKVGAHVPGDSSRSVVDPGRP
jgi:DNA-directed RNA polymerase II subunit RPB7